MRQELPDGTGGVSIHAPARGATPAGPRRRLRKCFNSRAREGRDNAAPLTQPTTGCFNSRAREGRDLKAVKLRGPANCFNSRAREGRDGAEVAWAARVRVSIHAPARGATGTIYHSKKSAEVSIHAPARGATRTFRECESAWTFQFTRPRGARRRKVQPQDKADCFNSRAREGRDPRCAMPGGIG